MKRPRSPEVAEADFWARLDVCVHGRACTVCCWPWRGACAKPCGDNPGGYGFVRWGGRVQKVSRVAWILCFRRPLGRQQLYRQCAMPRCGNPAHYATTLRRGMGYRPAKLTMAQLHAAHRRVLRGESCAGVARAYGVSQPALYNRLRRLERLDPVAQERRNHAQPRS